MQSQNNFNNNLNVGMNLVDNMIGQNIQQNQIIQNPYSNNNQSQKTEEQQSIDKRPKRSVNVKSVKNQNKKYSLESQDSSQNYQAENAGKRKKLNDTDAQNLQSQSIQESNQKQAENIPVGQRLLKMSYKKDLQREDWPDSENIEKRIQPFLDSVNKDFYLTKQDLELIYQCMDLTSLNSTDNQSYITNWLEQQLLKPFQFNKNLRPAAICVYPNIGQCVRQFISEHLIPDTKSAVVSSNFPSGQTYIDVKLLETKMAIKQGAQEVDMVVNRGSWNDGYCEKVLEEIQIIKKACSNVELKVILENCELKDLASIYKLSYLSLCAGADFIKSSTGKGKHGALLNEFAVMCLALKDFTQNKDDKSRGIKAAGGIKDCQTAWKFIQLSTQMTEIEFDYEQLPLFLRLGASSLAGEVMQELQKLEQVEEQN